MEFQTLTWYPFHIISSESKIAPLSYTSRINQNKECPITATSFPGFQTLWFSCSKSASFYIFRIVISAKIWHPLIYFPVATISSTLQPIFSDLSYTKVATFLTLWHTGSLKMVLLLGVASPYSSLLGLPPPPLRTLFDNCTCTSI